MKILLVLFFLNICLSANAQKAHNALSIGVVYSPLSSTDIGYRNKIVGSGSINITRHYYTGLNILKQINKRIFLESGIEYEKNRLKSTGVYPYNTTSTFQNLEYINIPLLMHLYVSRSIFLTAGVYGQLDNTKTDNLHTSGMGIQAGVGFRKEFKNKLSFVINPCGRVTVTNNKYLYSSSDVRLGLMYRIF